MAFIWQKLLKIALLLSKMALFWQKLLKTVSFRQNGFILAETA